MTNDEETEKQERVGSLARGVIIGALIVAYGWFLHLPQATFTQMFVVGIALQVLVIVVRRFVPAARQPRAQFVFEMIADGATVLVFAIGIYGGIARMSAEF